MSPEENTAPILVEPIADQYVVGDGVYSFTVPASTFYDPDPDDQLAYSALLEDGSALPAWLVFDPGARTFTTTPDINVSSALRVRLSATDIARAQATDTFDIVVIPPNLTIVGTRSSAKGSGLAM